MPFAFGKQFFVEGFRRRTCLRDHGNKSKFKKLFSTKGPRRIKKRSTRSEDKGKALGAKQTKRCRTTKMLFGNEFFEMHQILDFQRNIGFLLHT